MAQTGNPYDCGSRRIRRSQAACGAEDTYEKARLNDYAAVEKGVISQAIKEGGYKGLVDAILAAEKECKAVVVRDIIATYDGGTPTEGRGAGRQKTRTTGRSGVITFTDLGVVGNEDFWDTMEAQAGQYDHFFFGATKVWPLEADPTISAKNPIGEDVDTDIEGEATFTFSRRTLLKPYDYERAPLLKANAPFLPFTGLTAGGTASVQDEVVTVAKSATFSVTPAFTTSPAGSALTYKLAAGSDKPAGLTLLANGVVDAPAGIAVAGRYTVVVQAENPCGILGEVSITLVVTV